MSDIRAQAQRIADLALHMYDLPQGSTARLISLSENVAFLVEQHAPLGVLRVYRPGYHSELSRESELAWIEAIRATGIVQTPGVVPALDGRLLQQVDLDRDVHTVAMFEFVPGRLLGQDDMRAYSDVGRIAALLHLHGRSWQRPDWFQRPRWALADILDSGARWGDWCKGPGLTHEDRALLERLELRLRSHLTDYDLDDRNSALVHGDLRAANLLTDDVGRLWVIDFDDCGDGWLLWDLCTAIANIAHEPNVHEAVDAWLDGYLRVRHLEHRDLRMIPDLVLLRRLHMLAWLGSHPDSDPAREAGESFARQTCEIAQRHLRGEYLAGLRPR